jgi:hypothetical protein
MRVPKRCNFAGELGEYSGTEKYVNGDSGSVAASDEP